eukprot:TRINITY_DN108445_c0_g1_i1.p1 TRINITY_DN108445_c0_g1~~TRINITY_DN108445_c0_g1_i1.p1  ORF type:complete len:214 (-),score=17.93 TRINITY_DN108445_c0_g1_i1:112-753(-)
MWFCTCQEESTEDRDLVSVVQQDERDRVWPIRSNQGGEEYSITLERKCSDIGLILDSTDLKRIIVSSVRKNGLAFEHNMTAWAAKKICENDCIKSVNKISDGETILDVLQNVEVKRLEMVLQHAEERQVEVHKTSVSRSLGLVLITPLEAHFIGIDEVLSTGAVADWNHRNPDDPVRAHDKVLSVDGHTGFVTELVHMMLHKDAFVMTILTWR